MNTYSYRTCYAFGKKLKSGMVQENNIISWIEVLKSEEWKAFKFRKGLTDNQIYYVKLGFTGKEFDGEDQKGEAIIPFGKYKGQPMKSLSDNYILFLFKQEWLYKWPEVYDYVKKREAEINKDTDLTRDEIKSILKMK